MTTKSGVGLMRWAGGSFKNGTEKVAGAVGPDFLVGSVVGHWSPSWHIPAQCFSWRRQLCQIAWAVGGVRFIH